MSNTRHLQWLIPVITPLILAACDPRPQSQVDPAAFLGKLMESEGPQVDGVDATLLSSAKQAEEKREYQRAVQFYQQLMDKDKDSEVYILGLADNLRRLGQYNEASARYSALIVKNPDNLDALEGKGLCLLNKGDFDDASDLFKEILAKDNNRWRSLNAAGILFALKEMPKEALSYYDQALKVKPDEPAVLNNVGLTMAMMKNYPHAIDALTRAGRKLLDTDPQKKRADLNLALVYGLSGNMEKAEQVARRHLKESALNNNLGFYAYLADNQELAKAYLNNALSGSPVFYEKAWKNLEAIGGSKVEGGSSRYNNRNFAPQSKLMENYKTDDEPFSVYPPAEKLPDAEAAPVMPISQSQDLEDVVFAGDKNTAEAIAMPAMPPVLPKVAEKIADTSAATATVVTPAVVPAVAPIPKPEAKPVAALKTIPTPQPKPIAKLSSVPVKTQAEADLQPVSFTPQAPSQAVAAPTAMPPVIAPVEASVPRLSQAVDYIAEPTVTEPAAEVTQETSFDKSKILSKIHDTQKQEEVTTTLKPRTVENKIQQPAASDIEPLYDTQFQPARLKDPRSEMIVFQATPEEEKAAAPTPPAEVVAPPPAAVVPPAATVVAPATAATVVAPAPSAPSIAIEQEAVAAPAPTPAPAPAAVEAPAAAEEQPVQGTGRQSTFDAIKQIF